MFKKLRYKKTILVVVAIFFFAILISDNRYKKPHIAKITIDNIITQDSFRYEKLEELSQNKNTKAVIAFINSPGGTVVGGETLYKSIKNISQQKPIVSVMGEVATSAAYMASLGSDYIFAQEGTITGSVGVLILSSEITELAKKIGVSTEIIKSGDLKASPSPLEKMTPKAREQMEKIVKEISKNFIDLVKNHSSVALTVMRDLSAVIRKATERIMDLSTLAANNRVQADLLQLAIANMTENGQAIISPIPVHSDVASRVSTTRETVARVMGNLARQGVVERQRDKLVINDVAQLREMVEVVRGE